MCHHTRIALLLLVLDVCVCSYIGEQRVRDLEFSRLLGCMVTKDRVGPYKAGWQRPWLTLRVSEGRPGLLGPLTSRRYDQKQGYLYELAAETLSLAYATVLTLLYMTETAGCGIPSVFVGQTGLQASSDCVFEVDPTNGDVNIT